jgi:hypothetical protein
MTFLDCSPPRWKDKVLSQNDPGSIGLLRFGECRDGDDEQRAFERAPLKSLCLTFGCRYSFHRALLTRPMVA